MYLSISHTWIRSANQPSSEKLLIILFQNRPLIVCHVFRGGPADRCNLVKEGDVLVSVDHENVGDKTSGMQCIFFFCFQR
jgi:hypothetical protein